MTSKGLRGIAETVSSGGSFSNVSSSPSPKPSSKPKPKADTKVTSSRVIYESDPNQPGGLKPVTKIDVTKSGDTKVIDIKTGKTKFSGSVDAGTKASEIEVPELGIKSYSQQKADIDKKTLQDYKKTGVFKGSLQDYEELTGSRVSKSTLLKSGLKEKDIKKIEITAKSKPSTTLKQLRQKADAFDIVKVDVIKGARQPPKPKKITRIVKKDDKKQLKQFEIDKISLEKGQGTPSLKLDDKLKTFRKDLLFAEDIKTTKKLFKNEGWKVSFDEKGYIVRDKKGKVIKSFVGKEKPKPGTFHWAYGKPLKKLKQKVIAKAQKGDFGSGAQLTTGILNTATDKDGNKVISRQGLATKLAVNLLIGVGKGAVFSKVIKGVPKLAKAISKHPKKLTTIYIAGVGYNIAVNRNNPDQLKLTLAEEIGFIAGTKIGGISFKNIKNQKLSKLQSEKLIKNKFGTTKKPTKQQFLDKFKSLKSNTDKAKLVKAYVKKYKEMPDLEYSIPRKLESGATIMLDKKRLPIKVKVKPRRLRPLRKVRKAQKKKIDLEKKQTRKKFIELSKKQKQLESKAKENYNNNIIKSKRLVKRLKLNRLSKATSPIKVDGKPAFWLPISQKYSSNRVKFRKELRTLNNIDMKTEYEKFKDFDIYFRTLKAIEDSKIRIKTKNEILSKNKYNEVKNIRKKLLNNFNKILENKQKQIIFDTTNYAIVEYGKYDTLKKIKKSDIKKIDDKKAKILLEIANDKGKIVIKDNKKVYIYKNIDVESVDANGQTTITRQEVLVDIKSVPKQQSKQLVGIKQTLESKQIKKPLQYTVQQAKSKQKLISETKSKLKQKQKIKQKQKLETVLLTELDSKQEQKLKFKQEILQKQIPIQAIKQITLQQLKQVPLQKLKTLQKTKQLVKQVPQSVLKQLSKQKIKTIQLQKLKTLPQSILIQIPRQIKKPLTPDFEFEIEIPETKEKKKITYKQLIELYGFSPTLAGIGKKATKTTGTFTGLEIRGQIVPNKKPMVDVAKGGKTKLGNVAKVRFYRRKIPQRYSGKVLRENRNLLKKYGLLK